MKGIKRILIFILIIFSIGLGILGQVYSVTADTNCRDQGCSAGDALCAVIEYPSGTQVFCYAPYPQ